MTVQPESPTVTVNDISSQTHSIAKSSGTLHMAQVRAHRLAKAQLEWAPMTLISQDLQLMHKQSCVTRPPNTPVSRRQKRLYFSLGFGR